MTEINLNEAALEAAIHAWRCNPHGNGVDAAIRAYLSADPDRAARDAVVEAKWQTMESAPKSTVVNGCVRGVYILGFCPEEAIDPSSAISVIWWEPLMNQGRGQWVSEMNSDDVRPTLWHPLPPAPVAALPKEPTDG